jgi:hypothetical protein
MRVVCALHGGSWAKVVHADGRANAASFAAFEGVSEQFDVHMVVHNDQHTETLHEGSLQAPLQCAWPCYAGSHEAHLYVWRCWWCSGGGRGELAKRACMVFKKKRLCLWHACSIGKLLLAL